MILGGNLLGLLPGCPLFCFAQLQSRSLCSSKVGIGSADICNTITFFFLQLVAVGGGCPYILFDKFFEIFILSHSRLCQAMGVDEKSILEKVV